MNKLFLHFLNILVTGTPDVVGKNAFLRSLGECGNTRDWVGKKGWIFSFDVYVHDEEEMRRELGLSYRQTLCRIRSNSTCLLHFLQKPRENIPHLYGSSLRLTTLHYQMPLRLY